MVGIQHLHHSFEKSSSKDHLRLLEEGTANQLKPLLSSETASWPQQYPSGADVFISGLGTTRAAAGGFENQRKIDFDLNLELAKAAKESGTKSYVLISSGGASSSSPFGYAKMYVYCSMWRSPRLKHGCCHFIPYHKYIARLWNGNACHN